MLDMKFVRENPDKVMQAVANRNGNLDLTEFLELDKKRRELTQQVEALKNHAQFLTDDIDIIARGVNILTIDHNRTAINGFQAVDGTQQGGLARAAWPDNDYFFALLDFVINALEHFVIAKAFFQIFNGNHFFSNSFP